MEAKHKYYKRVNIVVFQIVVFKPFKIRLVTAHRTAKHRAEAAFRAGFYIIVKLKVHIKCRRTACCEIFKYSKLREPVNFLSVKLCFHWKDLLKKPVLQRHIVSI